MFLDPTITYRTQLKTSGGSLIQDIDPVAAPVAVAANTVTNAMLQAGVAVANIGYTPLNKAGDTATNLLITPAAPAITSAGYLGAPLNNQNANYTLAITDAGKMIRGTNAGAFTYTIPPVASVAWPIGTPIVFRNIGAGVCTVTRGAAVALQIAGSATSKDVAMAQWAFATAIMEATDQWVISGTGIS